MEFTDAETNWKRCAQSRRFTSGKVTKKRAELQNAPYYVIFTVVNENTNARVGTAIISVPTDGKRLPFEADCTSRGRVVGKLRGEWAIDLKVT